MTARYGAPTWLLALFEYAVRRPVPPPPNPHVRDHPASGADVGSATGSVVGGGRGAWAHVVEVREWLVRMELLCSRPEGSRFTSVCVDGAMDDGVGEPADGVALDAARSRDEREQHSPVERHEGGDRLW